MDTRQLAAFCAVVERRSFSQAADRLGVTQPAVSLQIRALEERLGQRLFDRSGRRVEPTEAGRRLYRNAQRMLHLEELMLEDVAASDKGRLTGTLDMGASTGPGAHLVPLLLCEFQRSHPELHVALSVSDTQFVIERVAGRELELPAELALGLARDLLEDLVFEREQPLRAAVEPQPSLGRLHSAAGAVEELGPEPLLERAHLERDCRLRHAEPLGRLREAASLDDGAEGGELARVHKDSLCDAGQVDM